MIGTWNLGTSLDDPPLFLPVRRPVSPLLVLLGIGVYMGNYEPRRVGGKVLV